MARVARKVRDKALLRLIGQYLRAGVLVGECLQPTETGVPQGSPLSPLLSNIVLDDLDKELERRGHRFARYCDDFLIVVHSQRAGERVKASLARFLRQHLKLEINETKSTVGPTNECTFLGFTFHGTRIYWSQEAFQDFRHRLRQLTGRSWGVSMACHSSCQIPISSCISTFARRPSSPRRSKARNRRSPISSFSNTRMHRESRWTT